MTEITRIEELKLLIEDKQNFLDHNEDIMTPLQKQVIKQNIDSMEKQLSELERSKKQETFSDLSDWIMDGHCAMRIIKGGNTNRVADRVAFIEKTPRVRLVRTKFGLERNKDGSGGVTDSQTDAWIYGPKGHAPEYGEYEPSREWCDNLLKALGWE